jgi:predicted nuclease of predicted toxin-antitoxin system
VQVLADENQHPHVVARLRNAGHEVEWIRETSRGASDEQILQRGDIANLVVVTDDRDFGDLIFNRAYPVPRAILYNRLNRTIPMISPIVWSHFWRTAVSKAT